MNTGRCGFSDRIKENWTFGWKVIEAWVAFEPKGTTLPFLIQPEDKLKPKERDQMLLRVAYESCEIRMQVRKEVPSFDRLVRKVSILTEQLLWRA